VDYITKPLAGAEVLARVRTHLRLRAAHESLMALQEERIRRLADTQQALMPLPENLPEAGFQVCMRQALRAGGDFYDVIPCGRRITDYIIADASGHDLGVSLWTASFKTLLTEYVSVLQAPGEILRMINSSLRRVLPEGAFFTAMYARLNRDNHKLILVNAGNPSAILISARTREAAVLHQEGDLIGIFHDAVFGVMETSLKPGDRLYLYSDGLVEINGIRDTGVHDLAEACRRVAERTLDEAVPSIVSSLCNRIEPDDDIVLMGIEV